MANETQVRADEELLELEQVLLSELKVRPRGQRDPDLAVTYPAKAKGSAAALELLGQVSVENGLGNNRPSWLQVAITPRKTHLVVQPVDETHKKNALPVVYNESGFSINLYKLFRKLDCLVPAGYRDIYDWELTPAPVRIGEVTGRGLRIRLGKAEREAIKVKTEAQKLEEKAKAAARKAKQEAARQAAAAKLAQHQHS